MVLVEFDMGVINVSAQANITATRKGRSLTCMDDDKLITIGAINAAVALPEMILVDSTEIKNTKLRVILGPNSPK